ncbi:MAG: vitamin K epoxide reductase family protein [Cytophagales bacterium]|nr:vitamin K epoxide reductase family protein [Armatimonadota bacterium]
MSTISPLSPIAAKTQTTPAAVADSANPLLNRVVFILSLVGLMIAGALWYWHANPVDIPCGASGGCETVAQSRYASFPPGSRYPVAMYGVLGYLAIVALAFLRTLPRSPTRDRGLVSGVALVSVLGTLISLQLTYVELFVLHAICRWCIASQVLILTIALISGGEWLRLLGLRRHAT